MQRVEADQDWSLFDPRVVPELTDLYGSDFEQAYVQAEAQGKAARRPGAQAVRADDAHAGRDRQRLDDLQGQVQPQPATRPARPATSSICPTCAPRSWRSPPMAKPPSATWARSTSRTTSIARPIRAAASSISQAGRNRAAGRAPARPRHRPELLPHRQRTPRQFALAPGRPWLHGLAGRTSSACVCPSTATRRERCPSDRRDHLFPRPGSLL
jgi:hypothetical protein